MECNGSFTESPAPGLSSGDNPTFIKSYFNKRGSILLLMWTPLLSMVDDCRIAAVSLVQMISLHGRPV